MGIVQSHLKKKKDEKIKEIETLNKSIEFLGIHQKLCNQQIEEKQEEKEKIDLQIYNKKEKYNKLSLECKICFDSLIEEILIPCGHCYCSKCAKNMTYCYICQQNIEKKYRIYKN